MTTFNKAVSSLLKGDQEGATKLFNQYVIEQSNKIQRAINEGMDLEDILSGLEDDADEDFGNIDVPLDESADLINADPDEAPEVLEGKTHRHNPDEDDSEELKKIVESDSTKFNNVDEGRLDLTQEENGDLVVKHTAGEGDEAPTASLQEQFEFELASALVKMRDGEFAVGDAGAPQKVTPVGDRNSTPTAITSTGEEKVGHELQPAPKATMVKASNALETSGDALEPVPSGGNSKAALNAWKEDLSAVTPVPKK